jgi:asparagine synthase (glutamine-hydrolysing)
MCGIAGTVDFDGAPADKELLERMAASLAHRGPDGSGIHVDGPFGLAHRRLSIIDLAGGAQPLCNEDGGVWTVFNGEIYNYKELRRELEGRGHLFKTASDTEVVVHLYEEHGATFPKYLNGMFAIAILDSKRRKLLLVRDRLGKKPLLYFRNGRHFAFASEMAALKLHPRMPREIDLQALWDYFSLLYVPSPRTIFKGVSKLPPGQILELDLARRFTGGGLYWSADFSRKEELDYDGAKTRLRELLEDSVRRRMIADVPLGAFLSGGVDSAIVAGLMCRVSEAPVKLFSIGFSDPLYDERPSIDATLSQLKSFAKASPETFSRVVEPDKFDVLEKLALRFGEPFADSSMLPTFLVCAFARENVTVALSGDGADEVFAGYERYLAMKWASLLDFVPTPLRKPLFSSFASLLPASASERGAKGRLRRFLDARWPPTPRTLSRHDFALRRELEKLRRRTAFDAFRPGPTHDYMRLA